MAILKQMKVKFNRKSFKTSSCDDREAERKEAVQTNVKEGHFNVIAMQGGESRKFTVSLSLLSNQEFLRLLDRSQEEYGFEQRGILTLVCSPCELEGILTRKAKDQQGNFGVAKVLARHSC